MTFYRGDEPREGQVVCRLVDIGLVAFIKQFGEARGITFEDSSSRRPLNAGAFRQGAQYMVFARVRRKLREECYSDFDMINEGAFGFSLGFHSLLGAMYLQLAFLMRNTDAVRYCRAPKCNKIISFDAPQETPEEMSERLFTKGKRKPQKPRSDKEFCDKACYMRWKRRNEKQEATLHIRGSANKEGHYVNLPSARIAHLLDGLRSAS